MYLEWERRRKSQVKLLAQRKKTIKISCFYCQARTALQTKSLCQHPTKPDSGNTHRARLAKLAWDGFSKSVWGKAKSCSLLWKREMKTIIATQISSCGLCLGVQAAWKLHPELKKQSNCVAKWSGCSPSQVPGDLEQIRLCPHRTEQ